MPWGCWVELEDKDVHCKEWEYIIELKTSKRRKRTPQCIESIVNVQHPALITSQEPGTVYELGY